MAHPLTARDLLGQRVGTYRIVRRLGVGGMSAVFEAHDEQLGRRAAIKVLHADFADAPEMTARFFNEARAASVVSHPGIVMVLAFSALSDGAPCLIMEYLDGEPLTQRLKRHQGQRMPGAVLLISQVAAALAAVHQHGIVHRDLKPDNIIVVRDHAVPGGERCKLLDFGIAKLRAEHMRSGARDVHTATGLLMGTPAYMSPEQCRGAADLDEKTDVYSLGVLLFRCLSGRFPLPVGSMGAQMESHLSRVPPHLTELDPTLPAALCDLVAAMLRKDPKARPSMAEVVAALHQVEGGPAEVGVTAPLPSVAPNPPDAPTVRRTEKLARWPRAAAAGLLGALALVSAILTSYILSPTQAQTQRPTPPAPVVARPALQLRSRPAGAAVVRAQDQRRLGVTPWSPADAADGGRLRLILRMPGYFDRHIEVDLDQGGVVEETMQEVSNERVPLLR